jgi:hypothetical protein
VCGCTAQAIYIACIMCFWQHVLPAAVPIPLSALSLILSCICCTTAVLRSTCLLQQSHKHQHTIDLTCYLLLDTSNCF